NPLAAPHEFIPQSMGFELRGSDLTALLRSAHRIIDTLGQEPIEIRPTRPTLESVFLHRTGRQLRD
ncbi:MAG: hypothetical protein ACRCZF_01525, partial [Gemmataceae bacterium]